MGRITVTRRVRAPLERVFDMVAHVERFREAVPEIVDVEFIGPTRKGVGTRFRETRRMGKRRATVELEVQEYVENDRVRIVSDAGGSVWDSLFTVAPADEGEVELTMVMEDRAYRLPAKLFNPLIRGTIRRAVERDLDAVKAACER